MKFSRDTVFLLILFVLLLLGMVLTLIFGGEKSRHGYGSTPEISGSILTAAAPEKKHFNYRVIKHNMPWQILSLCPKTCNDAPPRNRDN